MKIKPAPAHELPNPITHDDLMLLEEAFRQASIAKGLIERCKRCKIPVSEAEEDCDVTCDFLEAVYKEHKGPQAPIP